MKINDYTEEYAELVTFTPNRILPVHRWYPFVEGFSSVLVEKIILEQAEIPKLCFDPFGGVGTTALTCQMLGIDCISVEASPFIFDVARAKLNTGSFESLELASLIAKLEESLPKRRGSTTYPRIESSTFFKHSGIKKWVFHKSASDGIFDVLEELDNVCVGRLAKYKALLRLSLATFLPEISNVFRNGKCLSYRTGWQDRKPKRSEVHSRFLKHAKSVLLHDLRCLEFKGYAGLTNGNLVFGDSRSALVEHENKIDLVVTSPPYLNSRDYTDSYRLELWMLGYLGTFEKERALRATALTSHVQIHRPEVDYPKIKRLEKAIGHLERKETKLWNNNIPNMVRGYFGDLDKVLRTLKSRLANGAKLYFNVSNSSYANHVIEVDRIIGEMAELAGFRCEEIRVARRIKTSGQQMSVIDKSKMRESIVVLSYSEQNGPNSSR